jgi:hypothetical protein
MSEQPKFRLGQLVGLLDHNRKKPGLPSTHPEYRVDTGKVVKITRVWFYKHDNGQTHFEYDIAPSYQNSFFDRVHEVWLRPLTGQEITGRVTEPERLR